MKEIITVKLQLLIVTTFPFILLFYGCESECCEHQKDVLVFFDEFQWYPNNQVELLERTKTHYIPIVDKISKYVNRDVVCNVNVEYRTLGGKTGIGKEIDNYNAPPDVCYVNQNDIERDKEFDKFQKNKREIKDYFKKRDRDNTDQMNSQSIWTSIAPISKFIRDSESSNIEIIFCSDMYEAVPLSAKSVGSYCFIEKDMSYAYIDERQVLKAKEDCKDKSSLIGSEIAKCKKRINNSNLESITVSIVKINALDIHSRPGSPMNNEEIIEEYWIGFFSDLGIKNVRFLNSVEKLKI